MRFTYRSETFRQAWECGIWPGAPRWSLRRHTGSTWERKSLRGCSFGEQYAEAPSNNGEDVDMEEVAAGGDRNNMYALSRPCEILIVDPVSSLFFISSLIWSIHFISYHSPLHLEEF